MQSLALGLDRFSVAELALILFHPERRGTYSSKVQKEPGTWANSNIFKGHAAANPAFRWQPLQVS